MRMIFNDNGDNIYNKDNFFYAIEITHANAFANVRPE